MRNNVSELLDRACAGCVLLERNMRSRLLEARPLRALSWWRGHSILPNAAEANQGRWLAVAFEEQCEDASGRISFITGGKSFI
jgi:hypothetical protein